MTRDRKSAGEPLVEPGKRSGEGSDSILPHLQRQVQAKVKVPLPQQQPRQEQQDKAA